MKLKTFTLLLTILLLFAFQSTCFSETFKVMTEEYPPYNYTENNKLTGLSSEVVWAVLKKINHPDSIEMLPWSRSYNLIQKKSGYVLFSMKRTEARENMFKWVGDKIENIFNIKTTQLYIAFSKETSEETINKWQVALDELKAEGTYDKILSKYL